MRVYRIQHKDSHLGPYSDVRGELVLDTHGMCNSSTADHPCPTRDFGHGWKKQLGQGSDILFGFSTMRQLYAWFPKAIVNDLKATGFEIIQLRVRRRAALVSQKQIAFLKDGII